MPCYVVKDRVSVLRQASDGFQRINDFRCTLRRWHHCSVAIKATSALSLWGLDSSASVEFSWMLFDITGFNECLEHFEMQTGWETLCCILLLFCGEE